MITNRVKITLAQILRAALESVLEYPFVGSQISQLKDLIDSPPNRG